MKNEEINKNSFIDVEGSIWVGTTDEDRNMYIVFYVDTISGNSIVRRGRAINVQYASKDGIHVGIFYENDPMYKRIT